MPGGVIFVLAILTGRTRQSGATRQVPVKSLSSPGSLIPLRDKLSPVRQRGRVS